MKKICGVIFILLFNLVAIYANDEYLAPNEDIINKFELNPEIENLLRYDTLKSLENKKVLKTLKQDYKVPERNTTNILNIFNKDLEDIIQKINKNLEDIIQKISGPEEREIYRGMQRRFNEEYHKDIGNIPNNVLNDLKNIP